MGGTTGFLKTVLIPALISLGLYLILTYAILPFFHRYRQRYYQYLPLESISSHTISLRQRIGDAVASVILPSSWTSSRMGGGLAHDASEAESLVDDEEGEGMVGFDIDIRRREALERRRSGVGEGERRLSRDLEEGFRDDSDDDAGGLPGHDGPPRP